MSLRDKVQYSLLLALAVLVPLGLAVTFNESTPLPESCRPHPGGFDALFLPAISPDCRADLKAQ